MNRDNNSAIDRAMVIRGRGKKRGRGTSLNPIAERNVVSRGAEIRRFERPSGEKSVLDDAAVTVSPRSERFVYFVNIRDRLGEGSAYRRPQKHPVAIL